MTYLSVCSGIEAATVAWRPLGWKVAAFSEIEPYPCAVLAHHYPDVLNLGDMTAFKEWKLGPIDLLVGGTPCQSFSVAGLRRGLDDPRGNLMLVYLAIARQFAPRWVVWENVPGVLSSRKGRDFGSFLGGLAECGYGFAYRVLDAQFFGVPQRRRRVFVVGYLGDWRIAAAVLFERSSLRGYPAPSRETGEEVAAAIIERIGKGGFTDPVNDNIIAFDTTQITHPENRRRPEPGGPSPSLAKGGHAPAIAQTLVAHALRADGFDASEDGTGRGTPLVAGRSEHGYLDDGTLAGKEDLSSRSMREVRKGESGSASQRRRLAQQRSGESGAPVPELSREGTPSPTDMLDMREAGEGSRLLRQALSKIQTVGRPAPGEDQPEHARSSVRRLTPRECERLQGFPDDYTLIPYRGKPVADGPRYKALGNSMAVPVMRWIGERITAAQMELEARE